MNALNRLQRLESEANGPRCRRASLNRRCSHFRRLTPVGSFAVGLGLLIAIGSGTPASAQSRTLSWSHLDVQARLDADGVLHVSETQEMVMSGDWNGGERVFRQGIGRLSFDSLYRIDEAGSEPRQLKRGSLSEVDQWDFTDSSTLRWRSRAPSDPPFDAARLTYVLVYTMDHVLKTRDDLYVLDHDFAFTDRAGTIEQFTLDLQLDPVWVPVDDFQSRTTVSDLAPGRGVVVATVLRYGGTKSPAGVVRPPPKWLWLLFFIVVGLGLALMTRHFIDREAPLGRWAPLPPTDDLDPRDVELDLLAWRPEEAGALWDQTVGPSEVAAVIGRLVVEGKLKSEVEKGGRFSKPSLRLELLTERSDFTGYERKLIDKLFFNQRRIVDTKDLRKHYRSSGLDLVDLVRKPVEQRIEKKLRTVDERITISPTRTRWLLLGAILMVLLDVALRFRDLFVGNTVNAGLWILMGIMLLAVFLPGLALAFVTRRRVAGVRGRMVFLLAPPLIMAALFTLARIAFSEGASYRVGIAGTLAVALWILALSSSLFNLSRSRLNKSGLGVRRRLAHIREWIREELRKENPRLDDAWFPYLLALGLDRQVDQWFASFGSGARVAGTHIGSSASTLGGGHGGGSSPSWTGAGGAFGGAGATAGWAAAASTFAAGVSAASSGSSGGGGGGGGGGGSSGGGGGGGW